MEFLRLVHKNLRLFLKLSFLFSFFSSILTASSILQTDTDMEQPSTDSLKVASRTKARASRQYLNGSAFTNFQHVHPSFQIFILKRILNFYTNKKEIQEDISFYLCMSVSTFVCLLCLLPWETKKNSRASLQQLFTSILSVFWDLGIVDLIDSFKDVQKVLHGFHGLFEKWYIEDYKNLRKLSDLGISLKRHVFVDNSQCSEFLKFIAQVHLSNIPF